MPGVDWDAIDKEAEDYTRRMRKAKAMIDPTPTRAEVARYTAAGYDPGMIASHEGAWVSFDDYQSLRERAEAAETECTRLKNVRSAIAEGYNAEAVALEKAVSETLAAQLTAARRAEASAWNDAIEAAGNLESIHGYSNAVPRHRIRALRRAAPTEGEA